MFKKGTDQIIDVKETVISYKIMPNVKYRHHYYFFKLQLGVNFNVL